MLANCWPFSCEKYWPIVGPTESDKLEKEKAPLERRTECRDMLRARCKEPVDLRGLNTEPIRKKC